MRTQEGWRRMKEKQNEGKDKNKIWHVNEKSRLRKKVN